MEGYTRNPRSHFRPAPQPPPSAPTGTGYCNKGFTNGALLTGGNGFTAYDDVFGGPPKFGATPFAPRAEDYSEIFGSFRSSSSSSIPMLDLPPVDDSVAAFEVVGCSGMDYSDIFGGFDFADFAASYDELFRRSDDSEQASDDAWTPVGTESPTGESPYASSGRNKYFLDEDFHDTIEDKVFDYSYHNVNLGTTENLEHVYEPQPSSFPVYTYEVEGSDARKDDRERCRVADDIILFEDSCGNISVEAPWKTTYNEYGEKAGGANGISLNPGFLSFSDVSLKTDSPHLAPVSELPPTIVDTKRNPAGSTSDYEKCESNNIETIFAGGSFDFIDVELSAGSSSIASASAAAIQEAMERAKVKINSAKDLRKRKKDSVKDTLLTSRDRKVTMIFDETTSRGDEQQHLKDKRDFYAVKTYGDRVQVCSNSSEVLADPLQAEDAVNKAAQRKDAKNQRLPLDPVLTQGDCEWKVSTECFELVNNGNSNAGTSLADSTEKPVHEMNNCHFGIANGKTVHGKKIEQEVAGDDDVIKEREGSESADEACNPRGNRRRLRANKAASRNAFHEQMVKLAQDVHNHKPVVVGGGHLETMRSRKKGLEGDVAFQMPEMHHARISDQATDQVYCDRNHSEDFYLAGSELSSDEDLIQADTDEIGKGACRFDENESRGTYVASKGETPKWVEEFAETEDSGRGFNDAEDEEKEEVSVRKGAEGMKKVLDEFHEQKESTQKSGRNKQHDIDIVCENGARKTDECGKKLKECVDAQNIKKHDLATGGISKDAVNVAANGRPTVCKRDSRYSKEEEADEYEKEMKEPAESYEFENSQMDECWEVNVEQMKERKDDLLCELKTADQDNIPEEVVPEMRYESKEVESSNLLSSPDEVIIRSSEFSCESEEKVVDNTDGCKPSKQTQKAEGNQPLMYGRKESVEEQYVSCHTNQRVVGKETESINGDAAKKLKRKEECDREVELEKERERERELEAERARKVEEEKEKEREKVRVRRVEELREREKELENEERVRKVEEEKEKEREKVRVRRVEELREREKDLEEEERVRKVEEEKEKEREKVRVRRVEELREREKDLEERVRKVEEEWEREREREKDRMGVHLKTSVASALERGSAEARQRAMAEARERLEKACAEAREKSSKESQLRAERAAVERATAEARERALDKAMADRPPFGTRQPVERSVSEKFSSSTNIELRNCSSSTDLWISDKSDGGVQGESSQRCRARLERHRRTVDRVAKALAEKNMRDLIVQREQAERNRFAETLDADIKRWSNGKEGNLRALLSTLQYILGPESGWQSIPLTEVITCAAVKKAYRKATLCVHPDKLQQRGATIQQKYICEKVFDLLKDAWNRFNSEER